MAASEAPHQVRIAVALLWASLILSSVDFVASSSPVEDAFDWVMWLVYAGSTAVYAYLIVLVSRRVNWARIVILVMTLVLVVAAVYWPPDVGTDAWWSVVLLGASTVADAVAAICLFTGRGHAWFKKVEHEGAF